MIETIQVRAESLKRDVFLKVIQPDDDRIDALMILLHGKIKPEAAMEYLEGFALELDLEALCRRYHMAVVTPLTQNRYYISTPDYNCDQFIAHELPAFMKERYSIAESAETILAGISMGGFGAALIAAHTGVFRRVISISGAYIAKDVEIGNPEVWGSLTPVSPGLKKTFLNFFLPLDDLSRSAERNPVAALRLFAEKGEKSLFFVACGTEDWLFARNQDFVRELNRQNLEYQFYPIDKGMHEPDCFKEGLWKAVEFFFGKD